MARTHYDTLGVKRSATDAEIKAAYRKLALLYHPDRSSDPKASQMFIEIASAFKVLSHAEGRLSYDRSLEADRRREEERKSKADQDAAATRRAQEVRAKSASNVSAGSSARTARPSEPASPPASGISVATMVTRLSVLFTRQQFADCERLARDILRADSRQPLPYAVLGELARARGNFAEASRLYAFALQMDPRNPEYLRRYEEIIDRTQWTNAGMKTQIKPEERRVFAILAIVGIALTCCVYLILSLEQPVFRSAGPISTWTFGLMVMLFLCGVSAGASLSVANLVDRVHAFFLGKVAPAVSLGAVAIVSFPAAILLYLLLGLLQRGFNVTTTRLIVAVGGLTTALALASLASPSSISGSQVLLWGGNVVYLGALCGWVVADSFRK